MSLPWKLDPDRCFDPYPAHRNLARQFYETVAHLPIVSPHGHVPPTLLADPAATFGSPADLFIIPDHYIFRLLYSQGVSLSNLGITAQPDQPLETDHRRIWQHFAENFYLFRGTPSGLWLADVLTNIFGVQQKLNAQTAPHIYDELAAKLAQPEFSPRSLFKRFNIEVLCTTDAPWDALTEHPLLQAQGFNVRPTFRPDGVINLDAPAWRSNLANLEAACQRDITSYKLLVRCLEERRVVFREAGATATDHGVPTPYTESLSEAEAELIFGRALAGKASPDDTARFQGHMLIEMARMSVEDGLVMQLHAGSFRNHNAPLYEQFGADKGADIPLITEWTRNLRPLLNRFGNDNRLRLILFGLDESTYSRELAPLAGHYPAVLLGPPWWFHDSVNGMTRYFENVVETAGLYNTTGFNDDTRSFASIPARHDVWRRVSCNWLAGLTLRGLVDEAEAGEMALECASNLARQAYRLPLPTEQSHSAELN